MSRDVWTPLLEQDVGLHAGIALSPSSDSRSPELDFDWSNETSLFNGNGLDLDYNTITEGANENLIPDPALSPVVISPITPHSSAPVERQASPSPSHDKARMLSSSFLTPRNSGVDFAFPDWNRQAFWKPVLTSSTNWSSGSACYSAFLGEAIHQGHPDAFIERKQHAVGGEHEERETLFGQQILQVAQTMSPLLTLPHPHAHQPESHSNGLLRHLNTNSGAANIDLEGKDNSRTSSEACQGGARARPWACELCASRFSIKGHLSQHNRYVHEKYRPHTCPSCSASFGTRFARSQHIWTVHERKKPFVCEVPGCKASFGQRSHLNRHAKRHRSENDRKE
jgi:hypothetical protein